LKRREQASELFRAPFHHQTIVFSRKTLFRLSSVQAPDLRHGTTAGSKIHRYRSLRQTYFSDYLNTLPDPRPAPAIKRNNPELRWNCLRNYPPSKNRDFRVISNPFPGYLYVTEFTVNICRIAGTLRTVSGLSSNHMLLFLIRRLKIHDRERKD